MNIKETVSPQGKDCALTSFSSGPIKNVSTSATMFLQPLMILARHGLERCTASVWMKMMIGFPDIFCEAPNYSSYDLHEAFAVQLQEKPDLQVPPDSAPAGIDLVCDAPVCETLRFTSQLSHLEQKTLEISEVERILSKIFPH